MKAFIVPLVMLVAFGIGYAVVCRVNGPHVAARLRLRMALLSLIMVTSVAFVAFFVGALSRPLSDRAWSGLVLLALALLLGVIATWPLRVRAAGGLLFSADRGQREKLQFVPAAIWILIGISQMTMATVRRPGSPVPVLALCLGVFHLLSGLQRMEVRENGILRFDALIKWPQIQSYGWESEDTLWLNVRSHWGCFGPVIVRIPPRQKHALQQILAQHVPQETAAAGSSV